MKRLLYLILITFFVTACAGTSPEPKKDVEMVKDATEDVASSDVQKENLKAMQEQKDREARLKKMRALHEKEFQRISREVRLLEEEIARFNQKIMQAHLKSSSDREIKELIKNKQIAQLVKTTKTVAELKKRLRADLELNQGQIDKVLKYKKVLGMLEAATKTESLKKVLETKTAIGGVVAGQLLEEKKLLVQKVADLKVRVLKVVHARLKISKELNLELAFCTNLSILDRFIIHPAYYALDQYTLSKNDSDRIFEELEFVAASLPDYPDLILHLVGKTDERGSNTYNKDLGDRRWSGVVRQVELQLKRDQYKGLSFGEECHSERGDADLNLWWAENRVTEFVWALK